MLDIKTIVKRGWYWAAFGIMYVLVFRLLEARTVDFHVIHMWLDDVIPFCEYFIVPYYLWFPYVGLTVIYFVAFNKEKKENEKFFLSFAAGSALFIVLSALYPNIQELRPVLTGENVFEKMVMFLYRTDTPTNILPSLHVYNTIVSYIAIVENENCRKHKVLLWGTGLLSISIILATMFLKQHSAVDVIMALICNVICYVFVYWLPKKKRNK